jgi:hypothetical protein
MRWAGHVARLREERKVYGVLVGKPEGKRPLGRPRHRWEVGIRMDLRDIGLGGVDWSRLAQDRDRWRAVACAVMNLRVLAPRSLTYATAVLNTTRKFGGCESRKSGTFAMRHLDPVAALPTNILTVGYRIIILRISFDTDR